MSTRFQSVTLTMLLAAGMPFAGSLQAQTAHERAKVMESLPHYQIKTAIKGTLEIPFTDSLSDLGGEWTRGFRKYHPEAKLVFLPKLSGEAAKPFLGGTSNLVILARELTIAELEVFQTRFGYLPMRIPVCLDANIVFVHKDNPLTSISMEQLDAIFSRNRLGGAPAAAQVWGDLGVKGELARRTINAYTRAAGTALRASIAKVVLLDGEFRQGIIDRQDNSELAETVSMDSGGIAIGALASWYSINKVLAVTPYRGSEARFPSQEMVTSSKYPMPRLYYAYLNRAPGKPVDPAAGEMVNYFLSQEGQSMVAEVGLMPGPVEFISAALRRLAR